MPALLLLAHASSSRLAVDVPGKHAGLPLFMRHERALRSALVIVACALCLVRSAGAQRKMVVSPKKGITFGSLFPGVPFTVQPTDAALAGALDIVGPNRAQVKIDFTLPTSLSGPASAILPLSFTPTSGGYSQSGAVGGEVPFDPRVSYLNFLSNTGRATVYLGGTASPTAGQRSGSYSGTIIMTVALTGL